MSQFEKKEPVKYWLFNAWVSFVESFGRLKLLAVYGHKKIAKVRRLSSYSANCAISSKLQTKFKAIGIQTETLPEFVVIAGGRQLDLVSLKLINKVVNQSLGETLLTLSRWHIGKKELIMKKIRLVFLALALMLAGASSAYAHDSVGFSVNLGFPGYYAAPPPVVYYSPPPAVYYSPVPAYYNYYGPSVYYRSYEPRYYHDRGYRRGWDDHRGGHR